MDDQIRAEQDGCHTAWERRIAAEADDAVAVERVGGAGEHGFPAVFAEKRPLELGGKELPDVEEVLAGAGDAGE